MKENFEIIEIKQCKKGFKVKLAGLAYSSDTPYSYHSLPDIINSIQSRIEGIDEFLLMAEEFKTEINKKIKELENHK
jgi:hypothetical protein